MLLRPTYAAEMECLDLLVNVEGDTDRALIYYACDHNCCHELLSPYANALCRCGSKMVRKVKVVRGDREGEKYDGVFLIRTTRFIITDDLIVTPVSSIQAVFNLLGCDGTSLNNVMEKQVKVGLSEIIAILHQSLISKDALTKVFLAKENDKSADKKNSTFVHIPCPKPESVSSDNTIGIKLIVDKHKNKCLYAECKQDFVDILFSFLTYPSGFVMKRLNGKSHITCLDNLFASSLDKSISDCFKTHVMREYVNNPSLPSYFRLTESIVKSDEAPTMRYYMCRTPDCDSTEVSLVPNVQCKCKKITNKRMSITDPRRTGAYGFVNQGFVTDTTYIVTDDLVVTPFCSISTIALMIASATEGVVEIPVNIGEREVLALMEATLASQAVFTDAFLAKEESTADAISASGADSDCVLV